MSPSLYVHIPFCLKRCIYCDFVSGLYNPDRASDYIEALKREISNIPKEKSLSTLFIGGGTPTALPSDILSSLLNHIFTHFSFSPPLNKSARLDSEGGQEGVETTIEANPGTVDTVKLKAVRSAGINRISIGVQSFDDDELSFLGRIHTSEEAELAVHIAENSGFENIGIDLIYGIPGQDINTWKMTLEKAVTLRPNHISTYELTVEKGTELYKNINNPSLFLPLNKGRIGGVTLPAEDKAIEMYEHTIDYLTSAGYLHYEISNFSLPGYQCRHNLNYWDRGEYYGAGLGAHSFLNETRFHNTDNIDEYLELISEDKSAVKGSESITGDMALSEAIFLGLRKTGGINIETISKRYNVKILNIFHKEIEDLRAAGLIQITSSECAYETTMQLTRKGLVLSNEVFTKFIKLS
ncbi:MAG: radical SAM family heme chaperone HemW [Nitrospiraceae bacterium]|nr:MAG: radical SAM family heme chaperone HemW [Nitrospiraceae bacterium]